jgi:hypothetical protein
MRAGDRRVHRDGPIYAPTRICDRQQPIQHPIPGPVRSQPVMPCPHRLPRPEHHRQIPPGDPRPIPIDDALDHRPRVRERPPLTSRPPRQQPLDQRPLGIREQLKSRHATRLTPPTTNICQTRPRSSVTNNVRSPDPGTRTSGLAPECLRNHPASVRASRALSRGLPSGEPEVKAGARLFTSAAQAAAILSALPVSRDAHSSLGHS